MSTLAIDGGEPEVKGPLEPYNSFGAIERCAVEDLAFDAWAGTRSLSGFLGGAARGGRYVCELEELWAWKCNAKHAVACNSATSGLYAACAVLGVGPTSIVSVPALTMSATAGAPAMLFSHLRFDDVDADIFCSAPQTDCAVRIVTDLFGHPAPVGHGQTTIVDAAQAPFARDNVGGDIDVYSLNVHKHIQCGEGGVCVTNDEELAKNLREFVNHGELAGGNPGLNLRMTEMCAVIALAQLERAGELITGRVAQARCLTEAVRDLPGITPPTALPIAGQRHVYYIWAAKYLNGRDWFVKAMNAEGVPLRGGYVEPLYRLPAFKHYGGSCPVAERLHDQELVIFENCAYDPTPEQLNQISNAFAKVIEHAEKAR